MTDPLKAALVLLCIAAYVAAIIWTHTDRPQKPTGLAAIKPMTRRQRMADNALRAQLANSSPEEQRRILAEETARLTNQRRSVWDRIKDFPPPPAPGSILALMRKQKADADYYGTHSVPETTFGEAFRERASDRAPFVNVRDMALAAGLDLSREGNGPTNAYKLEGELKEAAVNDRLKVWGRPYNGPVRDNDPIVEIPAAHFRTYSFRHGFLEYADQPNDQTSTTTIRLRMANKDGVEGETFYDLRVERGVAKEIVRRFAERTDNEQG